MRSRLLTVVLAASLIGLWAPPASATVDTTPPQLHSIALSRETITVSGTEEQLLTVTVRLTDDVGVEVYDDWFAGRTPYVVFGLRSRHVGLVLGSGTPADGVYTGVIAVTSDWSGAVQPTRVVAQDTAGNDLDVDPRTVVATPSVVVHSSHRPRLEMTLTPDPVFPDRALTRTVRAWDSDTGQPWAGLPIALGYDNTCPEEGIRDPSGRTGADGVHRTTLAAGHTYPYVMCAWVTGDNVPGQRATRIAVTTAVARYKYVVTATPAATSVRAGTNVAVTGSLAPFQPNKLLHLQRRYGTEWRTVNSGITDQNSRFSLTATPPGVGTWYYRVFAPSEEHRSGNTSVTFTIRGT